MSEQNFCYWLRGFFELLQAGYKTSEKLTLTAEQVDMIDKHLKSVFTERIMAQPQPTIAAPLSITGPYCGPTMGGTCGGGHGGGVAPLIIGSQNPYDIKIEC